MSLEGKFVVFEGTDGVGKSTQVDLLKSKLIDEDYDVLHLSTPSNLYRNDEHVSHYNRYGDGLLRPTTLAMMAASDRLRTYDTEVLPHLDKGGVVICDRYKFSAEAYFEMRGADIPLLRSVHEQLPDPDYGILLTLDAVARLARLRTRETTEDWEEKDMSYQDKVQEKIKKGWRDTFAIIYASQPIEDVSKEVQDYLGQ